jgi:pyruvate-ferredoxin/flavodoxin oxidoreductase
MIEQKGDTLPVSAFPPDGTWPTATSQWEKRNIAIDIPVWDPAVCIQDNKCVMICPHAAIRAKVYDPALLDGGTPETFKSMDYKAGDFKGMKYTLQVAPEDCTGCGICVTVCPAKDKSNPRHKALEMAPQMPLREAEARNYDFFLSLPDPDRTKVKVDWKRSQFLRPLFEYSGACAACGETPYVKLLTQLFGDRALIGNATGCSSIYGGNLPTTPFAQDHNGRGPAWSNSLFEDNAEFSLGFRLAVDAQRRQAHDMLRSLSGKLGDEIVRSLIEADQIDELGIAQQRARVVELRRKLATLPDPAARRLDAIADYLVKKSVWAVGGDGWAYDIGYGGLDHVLAMNRDVNILVLDTEVYSNTGGQASKATPMGAAAKFATAGKGLGKKDLGLMAMSYGHVYVARVALGARDQQTVKAFLEADSYPGTSIIIAYCHCIAHGYDLVHGTEHQKLAVDSGIWPLYRFDPRRIAQGQAPLQLDAQPTGTKVSDLTKLETRFRMVEKLDPKRFQELMVRAQTEANQRVAVYQYLAGLMIPKAEGEAAAPADEK